MHPFENRNNKHIYYIAFFFCSALLLFFAYFPGLRGPLVFDDFINIVENPKLHVDELSFSSLVNAAFSTHTGPLARPVPMMSFALNYYLGGLNEFGYKLTNLIIHLVNGALFWLVAKTILARTMPRYSPSQISLAAFFASLAWLLHPLNITSVLYVVQRMVEFATMFGLWAIYFYILGRERNNFLETLRLHLVSSVFFVMAIMSKENMIVLIPLIAWLELILYRFKPLHPDQQKYMTYLRAAFVLAGGVLVTYLIVKFPTFVAAYDFRPFTMTERVLTQTRVLWIYIYQILLPDIGQMHLFHDEVIVSKSILEPATTGLSVVAIFSVVCMAIVKHKSWPLISLAVGWFFIGHLVESSFISLELMHDHRNYFPMMGIFILLGAAVIVGLSKKYVSTCIGMVIVGFVLTHATRLRAQDWSSWEVLVLTEAQKNPKSSRSQYEAGRYYYWNVEKSKDNTDTEAYKKAVHYFTQGYKASPTSLASLAALIRLNDAIEKPIPSEWVDELVARMGSTTPDSNDINKVNDIFRCRISDECKVDTEILLEIASAAVNNKALPALTKSSVASGTSGLALKEGRLDFSLHYAVLAVEITPERFEFFKSLVNVVKIHKDDVLLKEIIEKYGARYKSSDQLMWIKKNS